MKKNVPGLSCGRYPTEEIFAAYSKAGIEAMELSLMGEGEYARLGLEAERICAMAKHYGVELWSMHLPFGRETMNFCAPDAEVRAETMRAQLENLRVAHSLGIKNVVVHGGIPLPQTERKKYFAIARENVAALQNEASRFGITVCVENLMPSCIGRNSEELLSLLSAHPDLRVCLDPNHLLGESHSALIYALAGKIVTTHISDYDFLEERHWMPGEGKIDWPRLVAALKEVGYSGPFLYELSPWKTPNTIERRALTLEDYKENYLSLIEEKMPIAIGNPKKEICEEKTFANFCLQTYKITYENLMVETI